MPLTITRRKYQSVRIGEAVVTVRKTGARVVLTIDAPRDVPIVRDDARETEPRELPHPMLCVQHGGSPRCEASNTKHGFKCPRCDNGKD